MINQHICFIFQVELAKDLTESAKHKASKSKGSTPLVKSPKKKKEKPVANKILGEV